MKSMKKTLLKLQSLLIITMLVPSSIVYATTYTYELSEVQTWTDVGFL
jgi:hypothetical protein